MYTVPRIRKYRARTCVPLGRVSPRRYRADRLREHAVISRPGTALPSYPADLYNSAGFCKFLKYPPHGPAVSLNRAYYISSRTPEARGHALFSLLALSKFLTIWRGGLERHGEIGAFLYQINFYFSTSTSGTAAPPAGPSPAGMKMCRENLGWNKSRIYRLCRIDF